jgi:transcriptional regulator with XRE-family HTH domain
MRRALRENAGLTLLEIADACGCSFQSISAYELGTRTPRGKRLERYVEVLRLLQAENNRGTQEEAVA